MGLLLKSYSKYRKNTSVTSLEELAAKGYSKDEIAKRLGISPGTFRMRLANELSFYEAWEKGAKRAGTFQDKQRPWTLEIDENGTIETQPIDEMVLAALNRKQFQQKKVPSRKRISLLRELTGLELTKLVKSLERLVINLKVRQIEGVVFTEYEAYQEKK